MEQMTRLLLKEGYRDLIFVGSPNATKNITDRYLGIAKQCKGQAWKKSSFGSLRTGNVERELPAGD